jgi:hypothetical protein
MKGKVEIFEHIGDSLQLIKEESNLIVDGAMETVVDILTHRTAPSSISSVSLNAVSSYTVQAISLGPPQYNLKVKDSRDGVRYIHASGTHYLNVSGDGSGIHVLHTVPDSFATFGQTGRSSRYSQDGFVSFVTSIYPDEFALYSKAFDPVIEQDEFALTVKKPNGRATTTFESQVPFKFGKDYCLEFEGSGTVEVAVITTKASFGGKGGFQYFNFNTKIFDVGEHFVPLTLDPLGKVSLLFDNPYNQIDAAFVPQSLDLQYKILIRMPVNNLLTTELAEITKVTVLNADTYSLQNPEFKDKNSWLHNSNFDFFADLTLSSFNGELANSLNLKTIKGWKVISPLLNSTNPEIELSGLGYVSLSSFEGNSYGVKLVASSLTGSGAASISQVFVAPDFIKSTFLDYFSEKAGGYKPFLFLEFDLFQASSGAQGFNVELKDITTNEYFAFSGTANTVAEAWGTNIPLVAGKDHPGQFKRYSVMIPLGDKYDSLFEIFFKGNGTGSAFNTYILKNLSFASLPGWEYGFANTLSGSIMLPSFEAEPGIILSGNAAHSITGTTYANNVFIGSKFNGINPDKAYNLVIDAHSLSGTSVFNLLVAHKAFNNVNGSNETNLMAIAGLMKLDEPPVNNKSAYIGYLKYLNPYTSVSAYASPLSNDENREDYDITFKCVKYDGEFQTSGIRLFVPCDSGVHTMSWNLFKPESVEERPHLAIYFRARNNSDKHLWYNFTTRKFELFERNIVPPILYASSGDYTIDMEEESEFTFRVIGSQILNYVIPTSYYGALVLQTFGKREESMFPTLSEETYIWDWRLNGTYYPLDNTEWFEQSGRTGVAYYNGNGNWILSSLNGSLLGSMMEPYVPNALIEFSATTDSQTVIPIYGQNQFNANFESNDFGLGTIPTGATLDSTYDIFIFHKSGPGALFKKIGLVDLALGSYNGPESIAEVHIPTSENLAKYWIKSDFENGWILGLSSSPHTTKPVFGNFAVSGIKGISYSAGTANTVPGLVSYTVPVKNLDLVSNKFKFSIDYVNDLGNNTALYASLIYSKTDGKILIWDTVDNKFKPYLGNVSSSDLSGTYRIGSFPYNVANSTPVENWVSPTITLPYDRRDFDKITALFSIVPLGDSRLVLNNLRFYELTTLADASSVFPEFPNPVDKFVQTPTLSSIGHFENRIEEYYLKPQDYQSFEEAIYKGAYLPGSGLEIWSGTGYVSAYGNLNQYGVITPNGFILRQTKTHPNAQTIYDSSAGLIVSAVNPLVDRQIKYILTLTKEEWHFLNSRYGGIGAAGLWTLDYEQTARKLGSEEGLGGPPFLYSGSPDTLQSNYGGPGTYKASPVDAPYPLRNSKVLAAAGKRTGNCYFHTNFSSVPGRVNPNGWAVSGTSYQLSFLYKTNSRYASIVSDNFNEVPLPKNTQWESQAISFTASGKGYDSVLFKIRGERDPISNEIPYLLLDDVILQKTTGGISTIIEHNFSSVSALSHYRTSFPLKNNINLSIVWDGALYQSSLYNTSDLSNYEPVFRLFAKKVFFPGGLQINPASNFITIVWTIDF